MGRHHRIEADPRWESIVARDAGADGRFWFSVSTTGIYCRPGCPARTPQPDHVSIHETLAAARATGARPCRRCRPEETGRAAAEDAAIARAIAAIADAEEVPSIADLAGRAGLSPGRFRRLFAARTGLTPGAFAAARRAERARDALAAGDTVTVALHGAGYGSASSFYAAAPAALGMAPAAARDGGAGEHLRFATRPGPLGLMLVAQSDTGVAAILMGDDRDALIADLRRRFSRARLDEAEDALGPALAAVLALIHEPARAFALPLDARGTAFQQRVWDALRRIPSGATRSYTEVAAAIEAPGAVRAVAGACAANPLALAIPCHRVVRGDGGLSGYRWGVERKRALLAREAAASDLFGPDDTPD